MADASKLLIEIQKMIGCFYLSDLHTDCRSLSEQPKSLITAIPPTQYALQERNVAAAISQEKNAAIRPRRKPEQE